MQTRRAPRLDLQNVRPRVPAGSGQPQSDQRHHFRAAAQYVPEGFTVQTAIGTTIPQGNRGTTAGAANKGGGGGAPSAGGSGVVKLVIDDTENFTLCVLATPAAPAGVSAKTIGFTGEDTGTSPKLAHGFTDNTGGATLSAGSAVDRTTDTTGTIDSDVLDSYAYNSAAGSVCALVNGAADGIIAFTASSNVGLTDSICVTEDIDANTVNASGSTVSGSSKIYPSNF